MELALASTFESILKTHIGKYTIEKLFDWVMEAREEMEKQNDRSLIIVAGTFLDQILGVILEEFFINSNNKFTKDMFDGPSASVGSFSNKIKMCYALGLISQSEYSMMEQIRKIRNIAAHQLGGISFDNDNLKDHCPSLKEKLIQLVAEDSKLQLNNSKPREIFLLSAENLLNRFVARATQAKNAKRIIPKELHGNEIAQVIINDTNKINHPTNFIKSNQISCELKNQNSSQEDKIIEGMINKFITDKKAKVNTPSSDFKNQQRHGYPFFEEKNTGNSTESDTDDNLPASLPVKNNNV